ncbi:LPS biosynthesis protein [Desulfonema ishimotonii]|uniref:LPS biosynthesis protein n=1 Tax=Desulfonema ishimotonii TaxID=45657 RepID=A0A401FVB4_9BACT|nr:Wzz/FepE/Etk N-terminal domain-containing protein [Desulfonema ishimotonii]GBC60912.1 LPS biosynthesis protein [Desulfonema ishimotonii]
MENQQIEYKDIKGFIRRRKKTFIVVFLLIASAAVIAAFSLPTIYQATATIVIQEQQIPKEYVKSTITSYADERLKAIKRQVMSYDKLKEIIEQYGLYPEMRGKYTMNEIISKMRGAINLESESAKVTNRKTGKKITITIAFILSYENRNPDTVKMVTNVLADLFMEEDVRMREELASVTTAFLEEELKNLKKQIRDHENRISEYKQAHLGELPEYNSVNLQTIARLEREMDQIDSKMRNLQEEKIHLQGQLAGVDPLRPIIVDGKNVAMSPSERLKRLRLELVSLRSKLSDKHPDVRKLKREIRKLESQTTAPGDSVAKLKRLRESEGNLAEMKARLGPKHPDVKKLSREVRLLSKEVARLKTARSLGVMAAKMPDNPTYINLRSQIVSREAAIRGLIRDKGKIREDLRRYHRRVEKSPLVEKEYSELTRDYFSARDKYNEIMKKLMAARVAQGMEDTQRGERFSVKSRARRPEKPFKPNRTAIVFLGVVFASVLGFGMAAMQEFLDHSVKGENDIQRLADIPVLSVISLVETRYEKQRRRTRWVLGGIAGICVIAGALYMVDLYVMPVDELVTTIRTRMAKS